MKQPRALYLLCFISMWEYFSYYGMRVLLVLFLIHQLRYNDASAVTLFALYTSLVEMSGIVGGKLADSWLGLKKSIIAGGWLIAFGHLCMAIPGSDYAFFTGLGGIVVGTGLLRTNAAMLLGLHYEENDLRRESGYTLYYTGLNIGSFLAILLCGYVGETYGWHAGFSLAAFGMLAGCLALFFYQQILSDKGAPQKSEKAYWNLLRWGALALAPFVAGGALYQYAWTILIAPWLAALGFGYIFFQMGRWSAKEKRNGLWLVFYVFCLVIFYSLEEQLGSSLLLFSDRYVDRETWLGTVPASSLIIMNPLMILFAGPLLSRLWSHFRLDNLCMIGVSFLLMGIAFSLLSLGSSGASTGRDVSLMICLSSFLCIGLAELFIAPVIFAYASEVAPVQSQGVVMGMVATGYATANLLSGWISKAVTTFIPEDSTAATYGDVFGSVAWAVLGWAAMLLLLNYLLRGEEGERLSSG